MTTGACVQVLESKKTKARIAVLTAAGKDIVLEFSYEEGERHKRPVFQFLYLYDKR